MRIALISLLLLSLAIPSVLGFTNNYYTTATNDYYWTNTAWTITGTTSLYAQYNNVVTPSIYGYAYTKIDTSSIPDDATINSATLHYYVHSFTSSKGVTKIYDIYDGTNYIATNKAYTSTGWNSETYTSGELSGINVAGDTIFRYSTPNPGAGKARVMQIRAYEYLNAFSIQGDYAAYLTVDYTEASTGYCNGEYNGVGDWIITTNVICNDIEDILLDGELIIANGNFLALKNGINIIQKK